MRILLIATDPDRIAALKPLVGWGHRVRVAGREPDARAPLESGEVELVLSQSPPPDWLASLLKAIPQPAPPWLEIGAGPRGRIPALPESPGREALRDWVRRTAPHLDPVPFNRSSAMVICDDDEELLLDIIEVFLGDAPDQLTRIRQGFAEGDLKTVEKGAHSLKGASSNIAAEPLREAAQQLEWAARKGRAAAARAHFAEVQYQWHRLKKYLERFVLGQN